MCARIWGCSELNQMKDQLKSILPLGVKRWLFHRALAKQKVRWKAFAEAHPGDEFACNFCGNTASAFLTDGEDHAVLVEHQVLSGGLRRNSRCPHCGAKDRDRLVRFFLERQTNLLSSNQNLLHFAPEPELKSWFRSLPTIQQYTDADLNPLAADHIMDITQIPLADASVDVVICNHVLEHIPDDALAMRELHRVLTPGGWAVLQVPISLNLEKTYENWDVKTPAEKEVHFGQCDHVRIYGQDYGDRLAVAGFQVQQIRPDQFLSADEITRYSILPEEVIYYCTKPMN